ncbi:hypothetical protein GCM10022251_77560 [Phytohabitans flavus]|uniref:GIY-YIG domain-containing protein n=1 Tax=Phytohabitans flavus TaxID=1076124 RepID=A0A6F8XIL4_9ACTN|nr:hypothetical protein Pflav_000620 [Phytohabitans flavus]
MADSTLSDFSPSVPFTADDVTGAPAAGGVHVVLAGDDVIYVGESGNLRRRLRQHLNGPRSPLNNPGS